MMMKLSQNFKNLRKPAIDERNRDPHVGAKPLGISTKIMLAINLSYDILLRGGKDE